MRTPEDLVQAHEKVLQKVASGQLSPGQAQPISNLLEDSRRIIEMGEFDRRLRELEQPHDKDPDEAA